MCVYISCMCNAVYYMSDPVTLERAANEFFLFIIIIIYNFLL